MIEEVFGVSIPVRRDEREANAWLLASLGKLKRDDLLELVDAAPGYGFSWPDHIMTKADMIEELERQRAAHWDTVQTEKQLKAEAKQERMKHCVITAAECNAWLSTLPIKGMN